MMLLSLITVDSAGEKDAKGHGMTQTSATKT